MPYDELGNYIPGDDTPSLDEMRYEIAKRRKAETISDYLDQYISDPIRGVSTAGTELIKRLPGADLAQAAMNIGSGLFAIPAAVPYGVYKGIEAGEYGKSTNTAGQNFEEAMRELTYEPRTQGGRDIMENIAKAIEVSKLPPYIGHIYAPRAPLSANDVRVLAKRGIETGREIAAIPEDFRMAQQGLQRESNLGGTTYGAKLGALENATIGEYQRGKIRRAAEGAPEDTAYDPLRQRREQASVEVYNVPEGATAMYAVKQPGGQLVKAIDPVTGLPRELENSSVSGISNIYEDVRKQDQGQGLINQYLRTFVNKPGIQEVWEDFNAKKTAEEFPGAPSIDDAREAFQIKYPTSTARNARMIEHFDEFAALPEAQAIAAQLGISIPTFEDYQKRIEAANLWGQKGLTNYIQKYLGTKEDPALQLATQGFTFKDPERLIESAADAMNYASPDELRKQREAAGFNPEGEVAPFLKDKMTELKAVDAQLREMVVERNSIQEQARADNVNPENLPAFDSIRRQIRDKTAEKERLVQQVENYKLGKAYETLSDLAIEPRTGAQLKKKLSFAEKQLFPYLDKTPDEAVLYDIDPKTIERLGLTGMAHIFMDDILTGKIPIEQIGNISIPKYIQKFASDRMAKELAIKQNAKLREQKFNTYLEEQIQKVPKDMVFGNAAVLELTNAMPEDELVRHVSTDTEILNHCVGQGGREGGKYIPIVDTVTGETPKGSSGQPTVYVGNILKRGDVIGSVRDLVTGRTIGDIEFNRTANGDEYDINYASGFENGRMDPQYTEAVKNYLNSKASVIRGSGDGLAKNGIVDQEAMRRGDVRNITGLSDRELDQLSYDGLPRFLSREDIIALNNERKAMLPSAQLNSEVATLNNAYGELLDENQRLNFELQNAEDDTMREELMNRRSEIQNELAGIGTRIGNMPIEEITNIAREMINDAFPASRTTPRNRLQYLDIESPISLRIQPRIFETMREILRDQRDAVGAPLTDLQNLTVRTEWQRISRDIARSINGNMYNGRAVAGNIRRNPDRYGLGELSDQIIDGIARQVEEHGIQDPRTAVLESIDILQSSLPAPTVNRLNNFFGNLLRGITNEAFEQAIYDLQQMQQTYLNPPERSLIHDLTEDQRRMAVGEIQGRIRDLEQRIQRRPLVNSARPQEQAQDLVRVKDNMLDAIAEDHGRPVANYIREALDAINYSLDADPTLYIERIRQLAAQDEGAARRGFNMMADRLVEGVRANNEAARALREQGNAVAVPAIQAPEPREVTPLTDVLNMEMNRIRDNYDEGVYNAVDRTLTAINDNADLATNAPAFIERVRRNAETAQRNNDLTTYDILTHTADLLTRTLRENSQIAVPEQRRPTTPFPEFNGDMTENQARDRVEEILNDDTVDENDIRQLRDMINDPDNPQFRNSDQEAIGELNDMIEYRLGEQATTQQLRALPNNIVGNTTQNLINQYPERRQIQALINDIEHGEYGELPMAVINIEDEIARDELVSQIIEGLVEYRDSIPENQEVLLTAPQIADIVRSEIERQSQIRNLQPNNLRSFINDMTDVLDFDNPTDMMNTLDAIQLQYNRAGRDGLSEAIDAVRNQINAQTRNNRERGAIDQQRRVAREFTMDNAIDAIDEAFAAIERHLGDAVLDFAETQNNNTAAQFHPGYETPQYVAELRRRAREVTGNNRDALEMIADELESAFARSQRPEGHKDGGYIQSSKNRLLSPNTDEMRLALLKGK